MLCYVMLYNVMLCIGEGLDCFTFQAIRAQNPYARADANMVDKDGWPKNCQRVLPSNLANMFSKHFGAQFSPLRPTGAGKTAIYNVSRPSTVAVALHAQEEGYANYPTASMSLQAFKHEPTKRFQTISDLQRGHVLNRFQALQRQDRCMLEESLKQPRYIRTNTPR